LVRDRTQVLQNRHRRGPNCLNDQWATRAGSIDAERTCSPARSFPLLVKGTHNEGQILPHLLSIALGGTTSFGSLLTAVGGGGSLGNGDAGSTNAPWGVGGTGGCLHIQGSAGGSGRIVSGVATFNNWGGASRLSGSVGASNSDPGSTGYLYGGGGSGTLNGESAAAKAGGPGADGIVIVIEFLRP
jgi:hypothetical protein